MNEQDLVVSRHESKTLTKNDGFLSRMADVLNDEKVKYFFKDYFSTWSDAKTALMLMHTYVMIDEGYYQMHHRRLSSSEISTIVKYVVSDRNYRPMLVDAMQNFVSGSDEKFFGAFKQIAATAPMIAQLE